MEKIEGFHQIIDGILGACPTHAAVIYDDMESKEILTYEAMCQKIMVFIAELSNFFSEGVCVGLHATNSPDIICILLTILKMRATCCPLNLDECSQRILQNIGVQFIIVSQMCLDSNHYLEELLAKGELVKHQMKCIKDLFILEVSQNKEVHYSRRHRIEFIVMSSGSTGTQKVIQVPAKCILPNIIDLKDIFKVTHNDVIFMSAPPTFDACIVQIFISLLAKAALLVVSDEIMRQPQNLCHALFERNSVTILQATPSLVHMVGEVCLQEGIILSDTSLRVLCLGAEPFLHKNQLKKLIANSRSIELYNLYGISEVSSWASIERVDLDRFLGTEKSEEINTFQKGHCNEEGDDEARFDRNVSIGTPLSDTKIEVRNEDGDVVKEGFGEIWIGGKDRVCLVHNEKDMLQNTMRPTGDIGFLRNRKIYYVRRKYHQVKIFGRFIDLEKIENAAEEIDSVASSVCVYAKAEDEALGSVVLFLATKDNVLKEDVEASLLRSLHSKLPSNHLFFRFIFLKEIPLNAHGKKDRFKLQIMAVRYLHDGRPDHLHNKYENFGEFLADLFETAIRRKTNCHLKYDKMKNFLQNGGDSFAAVYLESQICDYMKFITSGELILPLLYDKLTSENFNEVFEYLKRELKRQGMVCNEAAKFDFEMPVLEKRNLNDHDVTADSNNANVFNKRRKIESSSINCEEKDTQIDDKLSYYNRNNIRSISAWKCGGIVTSQDNSGRSPKFPISIGSVNDNDDDGHHSIVKSVDSDGVYENRSEMPLGYNKKTSLSESRDEIGCYCSVSRGSRYTVCDFCRSHGSISVCLSVRASRMPKSSKAIEMRWQYNTSKCVDASPVIVCNGDHMSSIVYIGSHSHYFYAINTENGSLVWKVELGDRIESSAAVSKDGKKIIVGCYDHCVYVLSRRSGDVLWKLKTGDSVKSSPIVNNLNGRVFIGSHDHFMYSIDTENHVLVWRRNCEGGSIFSSPVLSEDGKVLFVGTLGGILIALHSSNGKMVWKFNAKKPIFSSPVCFDENICFGCVNGNVCVVNNVGVLRWNYKTSGPIFSSPCIVPSSKGHLILIGSHDKKIYCLVDDGELYWKAELDSQVYATPAFFTSDTTQSSKESQNEDSFWKGFVIACSTNGVMYLLNIKNGTVFKSTKLPHEVFSSPVVFDATAIVGCRDNNVCCIRYF